MRFALVAVLALAGCTSDPPATPSAAGPPVARLGEEFTLAVGGAANVDGTHFNLIFDGVSEDSRCPVGTTCIWEGNARISLTIRAAYAMGKKQIEVLDSGIQLNTSARFEQKREFEGYVVELRRLEPVPSADAPTLSYMATLLVSPK